MTVYNDGYQSQYDFFFSDYDGQIHVNDPSNPYQPGHPETLGPVVDHSNPDPQYQRDLQQFLGASSGIGYGALGDNVGGGYGLGSLFSNEFFLAALGLGLASGGAAAYGGFSAAGGAGTGAAAGAETLASPVPLTTGGSFLGATGEGIAPATSLAPELEGGTFAAAPATSFTGGQSGLTFSQALKLASAANSAANLGQNPSGSNAGSFVGSLAGAATGIPGASTVGSVAGGAAGSQFDSTGGGNTGGTAVAEGSGTQDIVNILGAAIGLGGAGLSLADQARLRSQLTDIYHLSQDQLNQINQLAQQYHTQQQAAYPQQVAETAQDRANRQLTFDESQAAYPQQIAQTAQDRATRGQVFGERQGIAQRLQDPTQLASGAQSLFNPYAQGVQDETVRAINRSQALAGTGDGGVANLAAAKALVPLNAQLYQQAMQNYLTSQTSALGGFDYPPTGPYTPNPAPAPGLPTTPNPPQPPNLQNPSTFLQPPGALNLGAGSGPGDIVGNLIKLLGLSNTPGLLQALGLTGSGFTDPTNPALGNIQGQDFSKLGTGLDTSNPGTTFTPEGSSDLSLLPPDSLAFN